MPSKFTHSMSRRAAIAGITLALLSERTTKADTEPANGFDYTNVEFPPMSAASAADCPEGYAWDFARGDRCVSMRGWCDGELWTCEGRPAAHAHPQFACLPTYKRHQRCARVWQPVEGGVTPEQTKTGLTRCCWKYKPKRLP